MAYNIRSHFGDLPRRTTTIRTDEPGASPLTCTVGGFRQRRFTIQPPSAQFGVVLEGAAPAHEVTVEANGPGMRLVPERMMANNPWIEAHVVRQETLPDAGSRWVLTVGLKKTAPVGRIDGQLFIPRVEDDGVGPVIPVLAEVSGPLRLQPSRAFMGLLEKQSVAERVVEVRPLSEAELPQAPPTIQVTGFGDCPVGVRLRVDDGHPSRVRVAVDAAKLKVGSFEHKLVVKVRYNGKPSELLLPVNGLVSPAAGSPSGTE